MTFTSMGQAGRVVPQRRKWPRAKFYSVIAAGSGRGFLQLDMVISGDLAPQLSAGQDAIEFLDSDNQPLLRYSGLGAIDANDRSLPALLSLDWGYLFAIHR